MASKPSTLPLRRYLAELSSKFPTQSPLPQGPLDAEVVFYRVNAGKLHTRSFCRSVSRHSHSAVSVTLRVGDVSSSMRCRRCGSQNITNQERMWERALVAVGKFTAELASLEATLTTPAGPTPFSSALVDRLAVHSSALRVLTQALRPPITTLEYFITDPEPTPEFLPDAERLLELLRCLCQESAVLSSLLAPLLAHVDAAFVARLRVDAAACRVGRNEGIPARELPSVRLFTQALYKGPRPAASLERALVHAAFAAAFNPLPTASLSERITAALPEPVSLESLAQLPPRTSLDPAAFTTSAGLDLQAYTKAAWEAARAAAAPELVAAVAAFVTKEIAAVKLTDEAQLVALTRNFGLRDTRMDVSSILERFPALLDPAEFSNSRVKTHFFPGPVVSWLKLLAPDSVVAAGPLPAGVDAHSVTHLTTALLEPIPGYSLTPAQIRDAFATAFDTLTPIPLPSAS